LIDGLRTRLNGVAGVVDIRGRGLMIGLELDRPCAELVARALEQGFLINVTAGSVVRLLPPLILDDEQATQIVEAVSELILTFLNADAPAADGRRPS
ncbi:MAG: aminotransferase class III-fold pyridoxal phosphate-dependent enzyme, partial [Halochromatium sp.]